VLFAIIAVMPLRSWLKSAAGYNLALGESIGRFDFTFLTDLLRAHGAGVPAVVAACVLMLLAYIIFWAFASGGLVHVFIRREERVVVREFIGNCVVYFWRILRLALLFLLIHCILVVIVGVIFLSLPLHPLQVDDEMQVIRLARVVVLLYVIAMCIVSVAHTYARIHLVDGVVVGALEAFSGGIRFVRKHFLSAIMLFILALAAFGIIIVLYALCRRILPEGMSGLVLAFFLSQVLIFCRIGVRLLVIGSGVELRREVYKSKGMLRQKVVTHS
jgi:hypothetical protein